MGDINRDPDLDRTPADPGSDLAATVKARGDDAEASGTADKTSPPEPTGVDDGVDGAAGTVRNQDKAAQ